MRRVLWYEWIAVVAIGAVGWLAAWAMGGGWA